MSKAAIQMYTKCASLELGSKGVRVNCIIPGCINTPIHRTTGLTQPIKEITEERHRNKCPLQRNGK